MTIKKEWQIHENEDEKIVIPFHRQLLVLGLKIGDILLVLCSFYLTLVMTNYKGYDLSDLFELFLSNENKIVHLIFLVIFLICCHFVFRSFGFYISKRLSSLLADIFEIVKAVVWICIFLFVSAVLFKLGIMTPNFIVFFFSATIVLISSSRLFLKGILYLSRINGRNLRYVLVLGTNQRAIELAQTLRDKKELGYVILGFIDDDWPGLGKFKKTCFKRIGGLDSFAEYLRQNVVDEVLVSLPIRSLYSQSHKIVGICEEHGVIVRFASNIFELNEKKLRHDYIGNQSMVTQYNTENIYYLFHMIKRLLDIFVSVFLLFLLTPLFVLVAVILKVSSPGPIFYSQKRVGFNKRIFKMHKFRSMVQGAEKMQQDLEQYNEVSGPVFKIKKDPRVTRFGRFLRRTSLDELPQLINVLKGEMSLVGPRPLPVRDFKGFEQDFHRKRFSVLPGLTCLWQINGRNNIEFEQWMELDLKYIDNWSLLLDLKILILTIPAILKKNGAS